METLYRKVETEDRLPTENDQYYTSNGLLDFCIRNGKGDFWDENDDFELYPHYWLEEIPDSTQTLETALQQIEKMEAEKAELVNEVKTALRVYKLLEHTQPDAFSLYIRDAESLIQKMKS